MKPPPMDVRPCGCVLNYVVEDGINTCRIAPCSTRCEWFNEQMREATRRDIPIEKKIIS